MEAMPLISRSGEALGVLSIHYRSLHCSTPRTQRLLDLLAREATEILERARADQQQRTEAQAG